MNTVVDTVAAMLGMMLGMRPSTMVQGMETMAKTHGRASVAHG